MVNQFTECIANENAVSWRSQPSIPWVLKISSQHVGAMTKQMEQKVAIQLAPVWPRIWLTGSLLPNTLKICQTYY